MRHPPSGVRLMIGELSVPAKVGVHFVQNLAGDRQQLHRLPRNGFLILRLGAAVRAIPKILKMAIRR